VIFISLLISDDIIIIYRYTARGAHIFVFNGDGGPTEGRAPENADRPTAGARKRLPSRHTTVHGIPLDGETRGWTAGRCTNYASWRNNTHAHAHNILTWAYNRYIYVQVSNIIILCCIINTSGKILVRRRRKTSVILCIYKYIHLSRRRCGVCCLCEPRDVSPR